jgi:hypothetical protein
VNKHHSDLLGTAEWAAFPHEEILPVVTHGVDLGDDLLEIGPAQGGDRLAAAPGQAARRG